MATLRVKNLVKRFGDTVAVNNVSFKVDDGEFMVLLGPSGSGKTTILRCIAGLEIPDEGEIYLDDDLINYVPPKDRDIAMVFQSYALYPHMTVYDNIAFPLKLRKLPRAEIDSRVKEVAELLRISHLLNRKPHQLSGGEQQRVALARAIVRKPRIFLMDEPLSNLDAKLRVYMRAELKKLQKELGVTTIYVTHDQVEAMTMADKVLVLNKGVIQQLATPNELYNKPANLFVAGFIGSPPMNLIEGSVVEENGAYYFVTPSFKYRLPKEIGELVASKTSDVILGIRPEDIRIVIGDGDDTAINGKVYVVEPLGRDLLVNVKVGDTLFKILAPADLQLESGQDILMAPDERKIHIFDKKTGKAIV